MSVPSEVTTHTVIFVYKRMWMLMLCLCRWKECPDELTNQDPQDNHVGTIGLTLVHKVKAGSQHDPTGHSTGQGRVLLAEAAHKEVRHAPQATCSRHEQRQYQHETCPADHSKLQQKRQ